MLTEANRFVAGLSSGGCAGEGEGGGGRGGVGIRQVVILILVHIHVHVHAVLFFKLSTVSNHFFRSRGEEQSHHGAPFAQGGRHRLLEEDGITICKLAEGAVVAVAVAVAVVKLLLLLIVYLVFNVIKHIFD